MKWGVLESTCRGNYLSTIGLNAIENDFVWVIERKGEIEGFGHLKVFDKDNLTKGHIW
jgi:hypothetical protein